MAAESDTRWVPVAVSADILDGTVIPARLPTGPIAIWRSASGRLYANGDRCPHRGMRLSNGFVRGETLSCIYHGWRFGPDGACQKIPAHPAVEPPKTINCGPLPVREVNGVVWVTQVLPAEGPSRFPGYDAMRSIVVAASPDVIAKAGGGATVGGAFSMQLGGKPVIAVMNASDPDETFMLVLVEEGLSVAERLTVSRAIEALRRGAEAMDAVA